MMPRRDAFGLQRLYTAGGRHASTIRELIGDDRSLDRVAVDAFLRGEWTPDRTMFAAVRQVPPSGPSPERSDQSFAEQLMRSVTRAIETAPRPLAVALSGGLDSAVVLALAHQLDPTIEAIVLEPNLPNYSEVTAAELTASEIGAALTIIDMEPGAFVRVLSKAIAAFEAPLYNLHPISKWLLAGSARGSYASILSGDGADQLFRHDTSANYLPLVGAAFDAHDVKLYAPFLDVKSVDRDPDKRPLRELAARLPIRDELVRGPKVSRLAPPIDFEVRGPIARLARMLNRPPPDLTNDIDHCRWGTLAILVESFEAFD